MTWYGTRGNVWNRHRIEAVVTECHGVRYPRVSCHLYNSKVDIDTLAQALGELVRVECE